VGITPRAGRPALGAEGQSGASSSGSAAGSGRRPRVALEALPRPEWEGRGGEVPAQERLQLPKPGEGLHHGAQPGDGRSAAGQRPASALIDASPALSSCSLDLLCKALPDGGAAISLLRNSKAPAPGEHKPLDSKRFGSYERFGSFMADVSEDVATLADRAGPGVSLAHVAETMRMAVIKGQLGADLGPGDKVRLLYALYGVHRAAEAQAALAPMLAATPGFQSLPPKQAWRMLLDQSAWGDGRHAGLRFENEPGYLGGMYNGLSRVLQAHQQGLMFDASMLEDLHDAATQGVYREMVLDDVDESWTGFIGAFRAAAERTRPAVVAASPQHAPGDAARDMYDLGQGFSDGDSVRFEIKAVNVTRDGLREFFADQKALHRESQRCTMVRPLVEEPGYWEPFKKHEKWDRKSRLRLVPPPLGRSAIKARAEAIIARYRKAWKALPRAATENAKLAVIAECVRRLEQAHLFTDGNSRTTGFLVLNKLLLENGSSPAMIADPNRFDAFSINELVQEIRQGQETFAAHCLA